MEDAWEIKVELIVASGVMQVCIEYCSYILVVKLKNCSEWCIFF